MIPVTREVRASSPFSIRECTWQSPITGVVWGAEEAMFALGDGTVRFWHPSEPGATVIQAHSGAVLCAVADGHSGGLITGGDDGRVVHTRIGGVSETLASPGGRWIDHVALAPWGGLAWAQGKIVEMSNARQRRTWQLTLSSGCGGLSFAPKGERLAVAHYGGATIVSFAHVGSEPEKLTWKGSHIAVTWSPDARFLITAMQEQAVHVWRLSDKRDLHMHGYPSKPRSFSWSAGREILATSGGSAALIWPFKGKNGPQGQVALEVGRHVSLAVSVAWHPVSNILAIGYRDGVVALAETGSDRLLYMRAPDGASIEHLAWRRDGAILAFGAENGAAGLVDCSSMRKS